MTTKVNNKSVRAVKVETTKTKAQNITMTVEEYENMRNRMFAELKAELAAEKAAANKERRDRIAAVKAAKQERADIVRDAYKTNASRVAYVKTWSDLFPAYVSKPFAVRSATVANVRVTSDEQYSDAISKLADGTADIVSIAVDYQPKMSYTKRNGDGDIETRETSASKAELLRRAGCEVVTYLYGHTEEFGFRPTYTIRHRVAGHCVAMFDGGRMIIGRDLRK